MKQKSFKLSLSLLLLGYGFLNFPIEANATELIATSVIVTNEETITYNNIISSVSNTTIDINIENKEKVELLNEELEISNLENLAFNKSSNLIYIFENPDINSKKVGILPSNAIGEINDFRIFDSDIDKFIAGEAEWFEIKSGKISGYIKNENLLIGTDAVDEINNSYNTKVKVISNSNVRVRIEASKESDTIDTLKPNSIVELNKEKYNENDIWIPVIIDGEEGYIRNDLVEFVNIVDYATEYIEPSKIQKTNNKKENYQKIIPPSDESPSAVVDYAMQFLGNPYVWGGTSLTNGCDCSGFVMKVYESFGVSLPHSSYSDRNVGKAISYDKIQPGDIVCYDGHVGIYAGNGKIINALNKRSGIVLTDINFDTVLAVRRVL